jgi:hypothetical protein
LTVNFATPFAHQTTSDYAAFNKALVIGRPFRQPLLTAPNPAAVSPGMEIFMSSAGAVADIYAWLDSTLSWAPATPPAPGDRLVATLWPLILNTPGGTSLGSVPMLERKPRRAIYENVDRTAVRDAVAALLVTAHADAVANPFSELLWHPSMRLIVAHDPLPVTLKAYFDGKLPVANEATRLADDFVAAAATALIKQLPVRAGERIGRAAPFLAGDPLPTAPPFPLGTIADPDRARRLTFITEDAAGEPLDPLYYLHILVRQMLLPAADRVISTLTNTVQGGALAHPLVSLFPVLNVATVPPARARVAGAYRFPIGDLANLHGSPRPPASPVSLADWRYTPTGSFEAQTRAGGAPIALAISPDHRNKVRAFWNDAALVAQANAICTELQIPTELVVALAGTESLPGLNPRSIRFEPLLQRNRTKLRASAAAAHELEYDKLVGLRATVTAARYLASELTELDVNFASARALKANRLAKLNVRLLVGDADRPNITANTGSAAAVAGYTITVRDPMLQGGPPPAATQAPGLTRFYSIAARAAGNAAIGPVEIAAARDGRLRRLRITVAQNTLGGAATITVMRNAAETPIAVTIPAGSLVGTDNAHTVDLARGDRIALRVVTAVGGAGQIRDIRSGIQFAPDDVGTVHTLEGFSPPAGVPAPYVGASVVRPGASALTWTQMEAVVNATEGARVSPGLLQTLVSTAITAVRYLRSLDPTIFARVGVPAPPQAAAQYMSSWLLDAGHSLLVGSAYLRQGYTRYDTRFDLPYVGAVYNGGNVTSVAKTQWGFQNVEWDYPDHAAPYFNATVDLFDGLPPPATSPTVRFMS